MSSSLVTSQTTVTTLVPLPWKDFSAASRLVGLMSEITRLAPWAANSRAQAKPMPLAPPVTTATLPLKRFGLVDIVTRWLDWSPREAAASLAFQAPYLMQFALRQQVSLIHPEEIIIAMAMFGWKRDFSLVSPCDRGDVIERAMMWRRSVSQGDP